MIAARNAVGWSFFLNGLCFASWISRVPDLRSDFDLGNGQLGLVLLAIAVGSLVALPTTGAAISAYGPRTVVRAGAVTAAVGLVGAGVGMGGSLVLTTLGLFVLGVGIGVWDVTMNVEGAEVERHLRRTVMPRFHAGFSLGAVVGALIGAGLVALGMPAFWHLTAVAVLALTVVWATSPAFVALVVPEAGERRAAGRAWLEPRTLAIGVLVLALAMTEGTANDWLAVALVDGYDASHSVGVAGFAVFVAAMTVTRFAGSNLLDRFGRSAVLWSTIATAFVGVVVIVFAGNPFLVVVGIVLWGAGASLGFPVGMSAAADDASHAPARVSVVSTIGYGAFLAGPPLLGFVGDRVDTLPSLLVVAAILLPAAFAVPATRRPVPTVS